MPLSSSFGPRAALLSLLAACSAPLPQAPTLQPSAQGLSSPLDRDADGYTATEDCDDTDDTIHPHQPEQCGNLRDDNCNGLADEGCPPASAPDEDTATTDEDDTAVVEEEEEEDEPLLDDSAFAAGDLVVTELMINPDALRDPEGEWLEIRNTSGRDIALRGLTLEVDGTRSVLSTAEVVSAGALVVVGPPALPSLQNEGGTLRLWAGAVLLDQVTWREADVHAGASWSLEPLIGWGSAPHRDNDDAAGWCASEERWGDRTDLGSPGTINPGCPSYDHDDDGYTRDDGDCQDGDGTIHPGAEEVWYDGVDQDCDGASDLDADRDGYMLGEDCDDTAGGIHPDATEVCNQVDDDCDGTTDLGAVDAAWWYPDADGDGYGEEGSRAAVWACTAPAQHVADSSDCDDADGGVNPGEAEICGDADDQDEDCSEGAAVCDEVAYPIGGATSSWTTSRYYRGNLYDAAADGTLVRFTMPLDLPSTGCDVDVYVFQASSTAGPWTVVWSDTVWGQGSGHLSSGTIDLETQSGQVYGLGMGWNCKATYYGEYGSFLGDDAGIGTFTGTHYDNAYGGASSSYTPAYTGAGSVAYEQVVYMTE